MLIWLLRLISLAALAGFSAAVWFAGPMLSFGDSRPFDSAWVRGAIIGAVAGLVLLYYGVRLILKLQAQRALERAIANAEERGQRCLHPEGADGRGHSDTEADGPASKFSL